MKFTNLLPFKPRFVLKQVYYKYLFDKQVKQNEEIVERVNRINSIDEENIILLSGYPKSGNTWLRFIILNYFCFLNNPDKEETLTYKELNSIQCQALEQKENTEFQKQYPNIVRTHFSFNKVFNKFRILYIYRNPLDTLISLYYFHKNREIPFGTFNIKYRNEISQIDNFIMANIYHWLHNYLSYSKNATFIISYEEMKENTFDIVKKMFLELGFELNEQILGKSIQKSSFESIKEMGSQSGQSFGMGAEGRFIGEFTRSGKMGQYREELSIDTINKVQWILNYYNIQMTL